MTVECSVALRSRGFGFITYKEMEMVDDAQKARPHHIDQRDVEVKRAMPREVSSAPFVHWLRRRISIVLDIGVCCNKSFE